MGNLKADGTGNILLGINPQGDFKINGDYSINSGSFLFSLRKLVNRKFDILKGGKISWTGSPYDAEIDVKAVYHLKASLDGLGIEVDSTSNYSRRVNVECIVELKKTNFSTRKFISAFTCQPSTTKQAKPFIQSSIPPTKLKWTNKWFPCLFLEVLVTKHKPLNNRVQVCCPTNWSNWLSAKSD